MINLIRFDCIELLGTPIPRLAVLPPPPPKFFFRPRRAVTPRYFAPITTPVLFSFFNPGAYRGEASFRGKRGSGEPNAAVSSPRGEKRLRRRSFGGARMKMKPE